MSGGAVGVFFPATPGKAPCPSPGGRSQRTELSPLARSATPFSGTCRSSTGCYGLQGSRTPGRLLATRFRPAHNVHALPEAPYGVIEYSPTQKQTG